MKVFHILLLQILTVCNIAYSETFSPPKSYNETNIIVNQAVVEEYTSSRVSPQDILRESSAKTRKKSNETFTNTLESKKIIIKQRNVPNTLKYEDVQHGNNTNYNNAPTYSKPNTDHPHFIIRDNFYMIQSNWQTIKGFFKEDWQSVILGYMNICNTVMLQPKEKAVKSQFLQIGTVGNLQSICTELKAVQHYSNIELQYYFAQNFIPYLLGDNALNTNTGTFTGYYYPTLNASMVKTATYKYPIYKKPLNFQNGQISYTRGEIESGSLAGQNLEIFWVDDFVDLYFLHIQGSGMLKLTDGTYTHVKFSAKNGHQYASLGKYMLEKGYIKKGSDTKQFLTENENIAFDIMGINKSYIFFEEDKSGVVKGSHGSELVDGRSLAVDNQFIPYGMMVFIDTKNYHQTMFTQDTGSAIKGVVRGDIFVGKGYEAGERAKTIHNTGFMYILVHKSQGFKWNTN